MKSINRLVVITAFVMAILIVAAPLTAAATGLNVPSTLVNVIEQDDTNSYYLTTLSNVPDGYAPLTNSTYLGWCLDYSVLMTRNVTYQAFLYSSLNPPADNFSSAPWDMVNYILNHKQGNANDTQHAIWYFINNTSSFTQTLSAAANATVEDALANGTGFVPGPGQTEAIMVYPENVVSGAGPFQDIIIEVSIATVPEYSVLLFALLWAAIPLVVLIRKKKAHV